MLVISPCAKANYVDHNLTDQASIINFVEYNWHLPAIPGSFDQALTSTDAQEGIPFDLAGMFTFRSAAPGRRCSIRRPVRSICETPIWPAGT